jgi:hypothetical protein
MVEKIGVNLQALSEMSAPVINITTNAKDILTELPRVANESTNGLFGYVILFTIFILTYWYLSDKSPLGEFRYSDIRALTIAFAISASIGITQISIGFLYSWVAVVFFILAYLVSFILLLTIENRQ